MTTLSTAYPGQCRHCMRRREIYSIQRKGGGNYRRANRWYSSSICGECATGLSKGQARFGAQFRTIARFEASRLRSIAMAYSVVVEKCFFDNNGDGDCIRAECPVCQPGQYTNIETSTADSRRPHHD